MRNLKTENDGNFRPRILMTHGEKWESLIKVSRRALSGLFDNKRQEIDQNFEIRKNLLVPGPVFTCKMSIIIRLDEVS